MHQISELYFQICIVINFRTRRDAHSNQPKIIKQSDFQLFNLGYN